MKNIDHLSKYAKLCTYYHSWKKKKKDFVILGCIILLVRDSIYAIAHYMSSPVRLSVCPSVRPSVCPSHRWISQTRLKLGSHNFHHRVAP